MQRVGCPVNGSRRLGASTAGICYKCFGRNTGLPHRTSRVCAAELVGSSVEHSHEVQRLSLTQSLDLDGTAPDGHPDNTAFSHAAAAPVSRARSRVKAAAAAAAASAVASSNGKSNSNSIVTSVRRLRTNSNSSHAAAAAATGSSSSSSASSSAVISAEAKQQQLQTSLAQTVSSSINEQHQVISPHSIASDTIISTFNSSSVADDAGATSSDDDDFNAELQAEFQESTCCQDVLDIIGDELARFAPFQTVTALNRLARLSRSLKWEDSRAVLVEPSFVRLLDRLYNQVAQLNAFQLSTTLYSCAVLQVPLEQLGSGSGSVCKLLPALEAAMTANIKEFNDRDVSGALYAYAQMKAKKHSSLNSIALLCTQAQSLANKQQMSGQSLSMSLWAVATLHTIQQQHGRRHSSSSSSSTKSFQCAAAALVSSARERLVSSDFSFDALGSQGVANSIWAAAKLNQHDELLLQKGCDWIAAHADQCKAQEILNVLWAAGAGRYRPRVLQTLTKHIAAKAEHLKPADVASLFHVLGIFGFQFTALLQPDQQAALLSRAQQLLPKMKPYEVTSLYWGLGMARVVDNELFKQLTSTVSKLQLQQLDAREQLQQRGMAAAGQQQQQQQQRDPQRQQQQQQSSDKKVHQLQVQAALISASNTRQAFQAYLAALLEEADVPPLDDRVLAAWKAAWIAGQRGSRSKQQQQHRQQPLLEDLRWMLQQLNIKAAIHERTSDELLFVDVQLIASGERRVALQLLDEHSCDMHGQKLASAQWEEDVLLKNGFDRVIWWRIAEWKRCPKAARVRLFAEVLRSAGVNPQERLVAAAEHAWQAGRMNQSSSRKGSDTQQQQQQGGAGLGMIGASGIRASEADLLMQDKGGDKAGGWASGGRGTRSRARSGNFKRR